MIKANELSLNSKVIQLFVPGPIAGAEKVILSGTSAMKEAGANIEIWVILETRVPKLAEKFIELARAQGIKTRLFECKSKFDLKLLKDLKEQIKKDSISVIHAHGIKAIFYGTLLKSKNLSLISTHHGTTSHTLAVRAYEWVEKIGLKKSKKVISVSYPMETYLIKKGIKKEKIVVIENPLSFKPVKREIPKNLFLELVYVGRLSEEKGCHILIKSLLQTASKLNIRLTIVGDGYQRPELEKLSKISGLDLNIDFLGFQNNISKIIADKDALVMPSLREGLPMTLIEACCMGLPVIASDVGAISSLVTNEKNGLLCEAGDIKSLAEGISKFYLKKELLQENALDMADEFIERFSSKVWANKTIETYTSVLAQL